MRRGKGDAGKQDDKKRKRKAEKTGLDEEEREKGRQKNRIG